MMSSKRLAAVAAVLAVALGAPAVARADAVTDWNLIATNAILAPPAPTPHASPLSFAMVQGAVYDAVNAIDGGHRPYLVAPAANPSDSKEAAVATAAFRVARRRSCPSPAAPTLAAAVRRRRSPPSPTGAAKDGGIAAGEAAAAAMLAARANDGRDGPFTFVHRHRAGRVAAVAAAFALDPTPWVGNVPPFLVPERRDAPLGRPEPAHEPRLRAATSTRSSRSARSRARRAPPIRRRRRSSGRHSRRPLYGGVMRSLSAKLTGWTSPTNARLFAMVSLAAADGAIGCWNDKYYWNFWRPIDAIREAATDGNPATEADPDWMPLFDPSTLTAPPLVDAGLPGPPVGSQLRQQRDPAHHAGRSSAPTRSRSTSQHALPGASRGTSTASRRRSRRSSTRASGAGSTSAPPTSRGRRSARRSPTGSRALLPAGPLTGGGGRGPGLRLSRPRATGPPRLALDAEALPDELLAADAERPRPPDGPSGAHGPEDAPADRSGPKDGAAVVDAGLDRAGRRRTVARGAVRRPELGAERPGGRGGAAAPREAERAARRRGADAGGGRGGAPPLLRARPRHPPVLRRRLDSSDEAWLAEAPRHPVFRLTARERSPA